jgi:hypothetical protein
MDRSPHQTARKKHSQFSNFERGAEVEQRLAGDQVQGASDPTAGRPPRAPSSSSTVTTHQRLQPRAYQQGKRSEQTVQVELWVPCTATCAVRSDPPRPALSECISGHRRRSYAAGLPDGRLGGPFYSYIYCHFAITVCFPLFQYNMQP